MKLLLWIALFTYGVIAQVQPGLPVCSESTEVSSCGEKCNCVWCNSRCINGGVDGPLDHSCTDYEYTTDCAIRMRYIWYFLVGGITIGVVVALCSCIGCCWRRARRDSVLTV
jgi:hypothetical protein